jgi:hypothetical protein
LAYLKALLVYIILIFEFDIILIAELFHLIKIDLYDARIKG